MNNFRIARPFRFTVWGFGLLLGLLVLLLFVLPYAVNIGSVQTKIVTHISKALPGQVRYSSLKLAFLPWPHAVINQGGYSDPDTLSIRFNSGFVRPKVWPLFMGRLELDTLRIDRPEITIVLPTRDPNVPDTLPTSSVREIKSQIRRALSDSSQLLGNITVQIDTGRLALVQGDQIRVDLSEVDLSAIISDNTVRLDLEGGANIVQRFEIQGQVDLSTASGSMALKLTNLITKRIQTLTAIPQGRGFPDSKMDISLWLETQNLASLDTRIRINASEMRIDNGPRSITIQGLLLEGDARWTAEQLDARVTQMRAASPKIRLSGSATWTKPADPADSAITLSIEDADLNVPEIRAVLLDLFGDVPEIQTTFNIVRGGNLSSLSASHTASAWGGLADMDNFEAEGNLSKGRILVPDNLFMLSDVEGNVAWSDGRLLGSDVTARLSNTTARDGSLTIGLLDGSKAFALDTTLSADLAELPAILKKLVRDKDGLALLEKLPPVNGQATGRLILGDRLDQISATVDTEARLKLLDAVLTISGNLENLATPQATVSLKARGDLGLQTLNWVRQEGGLPDELLPQSPLSITLADIVRAPNGAVNVRADISLASDMEISAALQIQPPVLQLKKLHVRDKASDAILSFHRPNDAAPWEISFNGNLEKSTVDKFYRQNLIDSGALKGNLQAKIDTVTPTRSTIQGSLEARKLALQDSFLGSVYVDEAILNGKANRLDIPSAAVRWHDHTIQISGKTTFLPKMVDVDLTVAADSLDVDEIMQVIERKIIATAARPANPAELPEVQGSVTIQIDDLALGGYRYVPLHAEIELAPDHTIADINTANVCGIALTGQIAITKDKTILKFTPYAKQTVLEHTSSCLTSLANTERYEGIIDVRGEVTSQGVGRDELIANLKGHADIRVTNGRIYNIGAAGFLTNVLSYFSLNQLIQGDMPDLTKDNFQYQSIESKLSVKDGLLHVEEGVLKSNAINLVAEGKYNIESDDLKLDVLVSPLTSLDWVIERIPVINKILKGTLVAVPVRVKGPAADPTVVPLSPSAVGTRVGGILKRTFEAPYRIVEPILPETSDAPQKSDDKATP
jgi:hypothetical protein